MKSKQEKDKKAEETFIIEEFRKYFPEFPQSEIIPREAPDFVVGDVGIELIEFQWKGSRESEEFQNEFAK